MAGRPRARRAPASALLLAPALLLADGHAQRQYPWPTGRGRAQPGHYGVSPHRAPRELSSKTLAWKWSTPEGRFSTTFNGGALIDDELSIYTASVDAIYKLSSAGRLVWKVVVHTSTIPVIDGGILYSSSKSGQMFALNMTTGTDIWVKQISERIGSDIASTGIRDGIVLTSTHSLVGEGDSRVTALNATSGEFLWDFPTDSQLWNFMPIFTDDGSFVFQDQIGGVYHLKLRNGEVLWKAGYKGGWDETWNDGVLMLGANGMVYAVHSTTKPPCDPHDPGDITAYRLSNGEVVWRQNTPYPPNSQPLVARLGEGPGLSVVLPIGMPASPPPVMRVFSWPLHTALQLALLHLSVFLGEWQSILWRLQPHKSVVKVYDADTGDIQATWEAPVLKKGFPEGDDEGMLPRHAQGSQPLCIPNLWASPSLDADGRIFLAHADGHVYVLRNDDGDDRFAGGSEVSSYYTGAAFGHPGPSIAPGMFAIVNCDTVYVFKD